VGSGISGFRVQGDGRREKSHGVGFRGFGV